ncbi:methionine ABC transporter ATP-binding protein [Candidatus Cetobacterium colombiensis]|uniref:ATP-binding cassette domain-containing protein n=1 Tax=Candidatus Cetobacterium colombiensis TaxID=3073100 RepID=A0ABU4WAD9_9FUSO|nr:ATP-binding cassette domain-containing protein [Candidatus Cetobacterium colombiensis]MDX8336169.1 ATP-binding cassette domain-containing protein [Candidatus Cetobacterium colombiensis]
MIQLKNIIKTYQNKGENIEALKELSFDFKKGEITGIIGYSGAGKSTLLRCINLLENPTSGEIIIDGVVLNNLNSKELRETRKKIGMVFQHFNLMRSRTVAKNIAYPLKGSGLSKKEIDERVNELLDLVGLKDKKDSYPSQLSGGQKQRVGIARALANKPNLILCDEATSALDPETTVSILKLLKKINKDLGVTIVLITHQMEVIKEICDSVIVMEDGIVKEEGDIIDIFSKPQAPITKRFLSTVFNNDKISNYLENISIKEEEKIVKLAYIGSNTEDAYISRISRDYSVDASILFGNIEIIKETPVGNLVIKLGGAEKNILNSIEYLNKNNIYTEVLKNGRKSI